MNEHVIHYFGDILGTMIREAAALRMQLEAAKQRIAQLEAERKPVTETVLETRD